MTQITTTGDGPAPPKGRLIIGSGILVLWFIAKVIGPAAIIASDLPVEWKALLSTALFVGVAKLCLLAIVLVLGRPGFVYLKARIFGIFGQAFARIAPPQEVSRLRYRIGLVMFLLPLLAGWLLPYIEDAAPQFARRERLADWIAEAVFVASFFVLGGDFWDKLRALFTYGAKAQLPAKGGDAAP